MGLGNGQIQRNPRFDRSGEAPGLPMGSTLASLPALPSPICRQISQDSPSHLLAFTFHWPMRAGCPLPLIFLTGLTLKKIAR